MPAFFRTAQILGITLLMVFAIGITYTRMGKACSVFGGGRNFGEEEKEVEDPLSLEIIYDTLYRDDLEFNTSKRYKINIKKNSIIVFCMKVEEGAEPELKIEGDISPVSLASPPFPHDIIGRLYYANNDGEIGLFVRNLQREKILKYSFFLDISEPLNANTIKKIPLDGGSVGFHIDLKGDDEIFIKFNSNLRSFIDAKVYNLYYIYSSDYQGYLLKSFKDSLNNSLNFQSDHQGRYYILITSNQIITSLHLTYILSSSPWSHELFWPFLIIFCLVITSIPFIFLFNKRKDLEPMEKYTSFASYSSLITLVLFCNLAGAYNTRSPVLMIIFYSSIVLYSISLGLQIYASYLRVASPFITCPHCLKRIDSRLTTFCCDRMIKRVSNNWYFEPVAFGLLFFLVYSSASYSTITRFAIELPVLPETTLWVGGIGCLFGGIVAWRINRDADRKKSWSFIIIGIALSILFPLFLSLILYLDFVGVFEPMKDVELVYPNVVRLLVRVNALPRIPQGTLLIFGVIVSFLSYLLICQVRITIISSKYRGKRNSISVGAS